MVGAGWLAPRVACLVALRSGLARHAPRLSPSTRLVQAHPRRVVKVAKQIEREIGNLMIFDKVRGGAGRPGGGRQAGLRAPGAGLLCTRRTAPAAPPLQAPA